MAMVENDGGGGGVITPGGNGICTISSSDLIGLQNNILSRLYKIEQFLMLLTGMNIQTTQLSDFTDELGLVTNATLINALRGWITEGTFSGVAISTLGWTMYNPCTGQDEAFPIVVTDENGVMQFGATTNGTLCGEAVQAWNDTADTVAALAEQDYGSLSSRSGGWDINVSRGVTIVTNTISGNALDMEMEVTQAGLYSIAAGHVFTNTASNTSYDDGILTVNGVTKMLTQGWIESPSVNIEKRAMSVATHLVLAAGDNVRYANNPSTWVNTITASYLTVCRISE